MPKNKQKSAKSPTKFSGVARLSDKKFVKVDDIIVAKIGADNCKKRLNFIPVSLHRV